LTNKPDKGNTTSNTHTVGMFFFLSFSPKFFFFY
jgi:hypothetical protein